MALLELCWDPRCSSRVEMGMLGNFLCCITGFKDPLTRKWEDGISLEMP